MASDDREVLVRYVHAHELDTVWPNVEPLLHRALQTGDGELDVSQLRLLVVQGSALLFVSEEGAAAVEMQRFPNYTVAHVIAIGGRLIATAEHFRQFRELLKVGGATKLQGWNSGSISRLWRRFGLRDIYTVQRCDL